MSLTFTPGQLRQRAELYHQLGQLTDAGIGLPQALESQRQRPVHPSFRRPLGRLSQRLNEGLTFGQALEFERDWMPPFDAALLHGGEQSGRLPNSFQLLAKHYQNRADLARQLLAYLIYPVFLLHFGLLVFPIARLQQLVLQGDIFGYVLQKLVVFTPLYAAVILGILAVQGNRGAHWRSFMEHALNVIPGLGMARRHLALSRLAASLEALLSAGVTMIEAWGLAAAASGSPVLHRLVQQATPQLYAGMTPAEMVNRNSFFPSTFASQYQTGETSGQLEQSLNRLRAFYEEEGFRKLKTFLVMAAGLLIGVVMLLVAWQVISFWLGYFKQIEQVIPS